MIKYWSIQSIDIIYRVITSYTKRQLLEQLLEEFPRKSCMAFKAVDDSHSSKLDLGKLQNYSRETIRISTRKFSEETRFVLVKPLLFEPAYSNAQKLCNLYNKHCIGLSIIMPQNSLGEDFAIYYSDSEPSKFSSR